MTFIITSSPHKVCLLLPPSMLQELCEDHYHHHITLITIIRSLSHWSHLTVCVWPRLGWHWPRARLGGGRPAPPGLGWLSTLSQYYINILCHFNTLAIIIHFTLIIDCDSPWIISIRTRMVCVWMRARPMEWQGESWLPSLCLAPANWGSRDHRERLD